MPKAQEVFSRIEKTKESLTALRTFFKDKYMEDVEYEDLHEQSKKINSQKKDIRDRINTRYHEEHTKLEDLKVDLASDVELLSDMLLTAYTKGEAIEIQDRSKQMILPIFTVKFKTE